MAFEKPQFNKPEQLPERKMPKAEAEQMLGEMDEYAKGLRGLLGEKQQELKKVKKINPERAEELRAEIEELEAQIAGLSEFSQEGKQEGAEFFEKN